MANVNDFPIRVEVLVFEGCPHAAAALTLAENVVGRLAPGSSVERIEVDTPEKAVSLGFLGSPSVRVNGEDIERRSGGQGALCCRTYWGEGVPPEWLMEAAVLRALKPKGILFLCVANSARSQMAEGIARALAPANVRVWSAGSRPTRVRPEALAVLGEIGIDISEQRSKAVSEIPADGVDTVVTLCAEEECPIFMGKARRLHWGLPDPGAVQGEQEERLRAFRGARDELRLRIAALFPGGVID